jgi:hypothetical protein
MRAEFRSEKLKEREHLEGMGVHGGNIKRILKTEYIRAWTGFMRLKTQASGRLS